MSRPAHATQHHLLAYLASVLAHALPATDLPEQYWHYRLLILLGPIGLISQAYHANLPCLPCIPRLSGSPPPPLLSCLVLYKGSHPKGWRNGRRVRGYCRTTSLTLRCRCFGLGTKGGHHVLGDLSYQYRSGILLLLL